MAVIEATAIIATLMEMLGLAGNQISIYKNEKFVKSVANFKQELTKQMSQNNSLSTQLYNAYQQNDANLVNKLIGRSPLGPSYTAIKKEREHLKDKFKQEDEELQKKNAHLNSAANTLASAESMSGNIFGSAAEDLVKTAAEQAVQGGLSQQIADKAKDEAKLEEVGVTKDKDKSQPNPGLDIKRIGPDKGPGSKPVY